MLTAVYLSVVLAVAYAAPQGFHDPPANVEAATAEFIREYNRLAQLAAQAPDIHIIMSDRRLDAPISNAVNTGPAVHPINPAFNKFAFSASLGGNKQFVPQTHTFPVAPVHHHRPAPRHGGHLAGHLAGHRTAPATPTLKWTGPLADTVPAGVHGLPRQVQDTPEVAAARAAHFAALNAAHAAATPSRHHF